MNILLFKTSGGRIISATRADENYVGYMNNQAQGIIDEVFSGDVVGDYACCDAELYKAAIKSGKVLQTTDAMPVDFDVCSKSDAVLNNKTILPKEGQNLESIAGSDMVVCHG